MIESDGVVKMDLASQQGVQLLGTISECVDRLHRYGYELYLDTHAVSWTNRRTIIVSGEPFRLIFGNAIQPTSTQALIFGLQLGWNDEEWQIEASVENEVYEPELVTETIWEQTYTAQDFAGCLKLLLQATADLIQQTSIYR